MTKHTRDNVAIVLNEIKSVGGEIEQVRVSAKGHRVIYWVLGGVKQVTIASRSPFARHSAISEVRRQARRA